MGAELFWVEGAFPGRVAVAARPRGGAWLADDLRSLRESGVDVLVSALAERDVRELQLEDEGAHAEAAGIHFIHLPMPNLLTPAFEHAAPVFRQLADFVRAGKCVAAHCYGGVGRSPLIIASTLALLEHDPEDAWERIARARGREVPDTLIQRRWVSSFALYCRDGS
jgi:protein-tyrosine phosphatase